VTVDREHVGDAQHRLERGGFSGATALGLWEIK
jgi:hypothetical protein